MSDMSEMTEPEPTWKIIDVVTVHGHGRVVIPKEIRERLRLKDGDKAMWVKDRDRFVLERVSGERALQWEKGPRYEVKRG